jgi:hypothetical protein
MQNSDVQKSIEEILNLRKPRTIFHLLRMLYSVAKNFLLSMNALLILIILYFGHLYLVKRRMARLALFRFLDKVT